MGIVLACPAMDGHDLTVALIDSIADTIDNPNDFRFVIVDNNSENPYNPDLYGLGRGDPFPVDVVRNNENRGYYWPLLQAAEFATDGDIVGLIHNDVLLYEKGWDRRVIQSFVDNSNLGMIGFVGSDEVDDRGGRGGGTMCHFRGSNGQPQSTGKKVTDLHPAILLDSVVMLVRKPAIKSLGIDDSIPICHFVDKIWPMRLYEAGWNTAVLGVEMDHLGGMTAVANTRYHDSAKKWLDERGMDDQGNPGLAIYLDAENRFLSEYRAKGFIPSRMRGWQLVRA